MLSDCLTTTKLVLVAAGQIGCVCTCSTVHTSHTQNILLPSSATHVESSSKEHGSEILEHGRQQAVLRFQSLQVKHLKTVGEHTPASERPLAFLRRPLLACRKARGLLLKSPPQWQTPAQLREPALLTQTAQTSRRPQTFTYPRAPCRHAHPTPVLPASKTSSIVLLLSFEKMLAPFPSSLQLCCADWASTTSC